MKFLTSGPDIPADLIAAQERGDAVFICGAGVSRTLGLPSFRGLVEAIYGELKEDWSLHPAENEVMRKNGRLAGQYDRMLRSLERRLAASNSGRGHGMRERVRAAIRSALAAPPTTDLPNHRALLELSRDAEGRLRLATTNFDTLFERAWPVGGQAPSHATASMPQPKTAGCEGVLHLHGRLADTNLSLLETDLVLTSAEFGDAYLRSGWASRYVYDLVRAYTVVLVGYQADDPPMRYLLEVLEADRERYPDIKKVYAFASDEGDSALQTALWRAKGVEPILHSVVAHDYSSLYDTIREWNEYAQDPTAWRRNQLRLLFSQPQPPDQATVERCVELLSHADATQILAELAPPAFWLSTLFEGGTFDREKAVPGPWIAKRLDDPEMIRACCHSRGLDARSISVVKRALERERGTLSAARRQAWELLFSAWSQRSDDDVEASWFDLARRLEQDAGYQGRRIIASLLRPRLAVNKPYFRGAIADINESLFSLVSVDFVSSRHVSPSEVLEKWPNTKTGAIELIRTLERTLTDALEQAQEVGFLDGWDRSDSDVPSVAPHQQNAHHDGFYPIVRVVADLWSRLSELDSELARSIALAWVPHPFKLFKRLALFAAVNAAFPAHSAGTVVATLDDDVFWASGAQVEIMRLLVSRWESFPDGQRNELERRLSNGPPRELYEPSQFATEKEWESVHDHSVYRRLGRLQNSGKMLSGESLRIFADIQNRQPGWKLSPGERDDFRSWSESRAGLDGNPELLRDIEDHRIVDEALRIQRERAYHEGDLWRVFCSSDPERALRGLTLRGSAGTWQPEAWIPLLWALGENDDQLLQAAIADQFLEMPTTAIQVLLVQVVYWLQRRQELLVDPDLPGGPRFWLLWNRMSDLAISGGGGDWAVGNDIEAQLLSDPANSLAAMLIERLNTLRPRARSGLDSDFRPRFEKFMQSKSISALAARAQFARFLNYLHGIDPTWVIANLVPRFGWAHGDALALWTSRSRDQFGPPALFNKLKKGLLLAFVNPSLSSGSLESLAETVLRILIWQRHGNGAGYKVTAKDLRGILTVAPASVRRHLSWQLWRLMAEMAPTEKAVHWRTIVGPVFEAAWPLDANLRNRETSHNMIMMALEADEAFPDAVAAIVNMVVPHRVDRISHILQLERKHQTLLDKFPRSFVTLMNALIDPLDQPVPSDLGKVLDDCLAADPSIQAEPGFRRLSGLCRMSSA